MDNIKRYMDIVLYRTYAQLKSESQEFYLGFLWFILEPLLYTATLYLIFGVLIGGRGIDFVLYLLVGMIVWQFFDGGVMEGMNAIRSKIGIFNSVYLPKYVFPWVQILTVCTKFLFVLSIILVFSMVIGSKLTVASFLMLLGLIVIQLTLISGIATALAVYATYYGDLVRVVTAVMRLLFYVSGIFFSLDLVPAHLKTLFLANPVASLIICYRDVIIHGKMPNINLIAYILAFSIIGNIIGLLICKKFDKRMLREVSS